MTIIKKPFLGVILLIGLILLLALTGCTGKAEESITGNVISDTNDNQDNINKDEIVVITMTRCPECRDGLKPYLDKAKEQGANIKEYQVSSPMDPAVNQILSENGLNRPGRGMPIVCINDNCFTIMRTVEAELTRFLEQK